MSTPEDLKDLYIDELKDLWSANDQMARLLKKVSSKASDAQLKEMLAKSQEGISKHTDVVKELIVAQGERLPRSTAREWKGSSLRRQSTSSKRGRRRGLCSMP